MTPWFETLRGMIFPWQCDHMGHANNRSYPPFFDDASLSLWSQVGLSERKLRTEHRTAVVIARHITDYHHEMLSGDQFVVRSAFTRAGTKSLTCLSRLYNADTDVLCVSQSSVMVFFDAEARRSTAMPDSVRALVEPLLVDVGEG